MLKLETNSQSGETVLSFISRSAMNCLTKQLTEISTAIPNLGSEVKNLLYHSTPCFLLLTPVKTETKSLLSHYPLRDFHVIIRQQKIQTIC